MIKLEVGKKYNVESKISGNEYEYPLEVVYITDKQACTKHPDKSLDVLFLGNYTFSEYTEPEKLKLERVTDFQEGGAIYAKHLNAEFNNIIDYINSKFNVGDKE